MKTKRKQKELATMPPGKGVHYISIEYCETFHPKSSNEPPTLDPPTTKHDLEKSLIVLDSDNDRPTPLPKKAKCGKSWSI